MHVRKTSDTAAQTLCCLVIGLAAALPAAAQENATDQNKDTAEAAATSEAAAASVAPEEEAFKPSIGDVDKYKASAEAGDAEAQYRLGMCYLQEKSDAANAESALTWLRKAAEAQHAQACAQVARCLMDSGDGAAAAEILKCLRCGYAQKLPESSYLLYRLYKQGFGKLKKNESAAFHWLQEAADAGFPEAQYWLGREYRLGRIVAQDLKLAEKYEKMAKDAGYEAPLIRSAENEKTVKEVVARHILLLTTNNVADPFENFAQTVDYYGDKNMSLSAVKRDHANYERSYPQRIFKVDDISVKQNSNDEYTVTADYSCILVSSSDKIQGLVVRGTFVLRQIPGEGFKITGADSKTLRRFTPTEQSVQEFADYLSRHPELVRLANRSGSAASPAAPSAATPTAQLDEAAAVETALAVYGSESSDGGTYRSDLLSDRQIDYYTDGPVKKDFILRDRRGYTAKFVQREFICDSYRTQRISDTCVRVIINGTVHLRSKDGKRHNFKIVREMDVSLEPGAGCRVTRMREDIVSRF